MKDENIVQLVFHLPQVRLIELEVVDLGIAQIQHLSFDQWYTLETPGVVDWQRDYEAGHPAFVLYQIPLEETSYDQADKQRPFPILKNLVDLVWLALVITFGKPMPHPDLSLQYSRIHYKESNESATQEIVYPYIGYCEYDLLKSPLDIYFNIGEKEACHLQHNILLLIKAFQVGWFNIFLRLYEPLRILANIKSNSIDALLHLVRAFDDLTGSEEQSSFGQLRRQFALRFAVMTTFNEANIERQIVLGELLYKFRSKLVHGERYEQVLRELVSQYPDLQELLFKLLLICASRFASLICKNQEEAPSLADVVQRLDNVCREFRKDSNELISFLEDSGKETFYSCY